MKQLNNFIQEKLKINQDIKVNDKEKNTLDDSFIDTLDAIINDLEGSNFKSQWSLEFLYNIFCAAMPEKAEVMHTAYNEKGERLNDLEMCTIKCGKNTFKIEEDRNGQLRFTDNGDFLDVFGSKRKNEFNFGLALITDVFIKSNHFKINSEKLSDNEIKKLLSIDPSKVESNINFYNINGWKLYQGNLYEKNVSKSLSNNIYICIILPDDKNFKEYYVTYGAGLYGSKLSYQGEDENDFIDTINGLMEKHLGIK